MADLTLNLFINSHSHGWVILGNVINLEVSGAVRSWQPDDLQSLAPNGLTTPFSAPFRAFPLYLLVRHPYRVRIVGFAQSLFNFAAEPRVVCGGLMNTALAFGGVGPTAAFIRGLFGRPVGGVDFHLARAQGM